jgi:hypothetical protein
MRRFSGREKGRERLVLSRMSLTAVNRPTCCGTRPGTFGIPKCRVVRIESSLGDNRLVAETLPVDAVGRLERPNPVAGDGSANGIVALFGRCVGWNPGCQGSAVAGRLVIGRAFVASSLQGARLRLSPAAAFQPRCRSTASTCLHPRYGRSLQRRPQRHCLPAPDTD